MSRHLIVTGFHRSGTSLAAEIVHRAGLFLGDRLLGPMPSNERGHFEDLEFVRFHDELLRANGRSWVVREAFNPQVAGGLADRATELIGERDRRYEAWGFKDPRASLFLDLWNRWLPDLRVIVIYRHPDVAASSLVRRESQMARRWWRRPDSGRTVSKDPAVALDMWLTYNQAIVGFAESHPDSVLVIQAESLALGTLVTSRLQEWGFAVERVDQASVFRPGLLSDGGGGSVEPALGETWEALNRLADLR